MSTTPTAPPVDKELSAAELQAKYSTGDSWGKHPDHTPTDWQYAVANGDTRSGYWDWVVSEVELRSDEDGEDSTDAPG